MSQRLFCGGTQNGEDDLLVDEANFGLGGVNVDVNAAGVHLKHYKVGGIGVVGYEFCVGTFDGGRKPQVAYVSSVDEEVLFAASPFGVFRFAHIAFQSHWFGLFFNRIESFLEVESEECCDAADEAVGTQVVE